MKTFRIEIGRNTFWQVLAFLAIGLLFYYAKEAVGILFIGIVISLGIDPIVSFLERHRINRLLGTLFVFLAALIVLSASIYFVVPNLVVELSSLVSRLNEVFSDIFGFGAPQELIKTLNLNLNRILEVVNASQISISGTVSKVLQNIVFTIGVIVISFYLSLEKNGTERLLKVILPSIYEKPVLNVFERFKKKIRRWVGAQLALSVIVGVVVGLGLWILGVRYALTLAFLAAVFELVPVIGPTLSGLIAILVALPESLMLGVYVLLLFFIVQQLENHILIPVIMKKSMRIHPIIVLIALFAGGHAAGIVGMILAVPIALLAQEVFNYIAEHKALESEQA